MRSRGYSIRLYAVFTDWNATKEDAYRYESLIISRFVSLFWECSLIWRSPHRLSLRSFYDTTRTDLNALFGHLIACMFINYWTFFFVPISAEALRCRLIAYCNTKKSISKSRQTTREHQQSRAEKFQKRRILHPINNWQNDFKNKTTSSGTFLRPFFVE